MPDLDNRLARSRTALLDEIEQPPLADVRRRARRIRRRRSTAAGATVLALLAVIGIGARPWQHDSTPDITATRPPAIAPVYQGGGIKITGLSPDPVLSLDGAIADVEFTDPQHGVAAAGCDKECPPLASTADGGVHWQEVAQSPSGAGLTDVIAFPGGRWLLRGTDLYWASADATRWHIVTPPTQTSRASIGKGELPQAEQPAGRVIVVSPDRGPLGPLAHQPGLAVRWVAPAPAGDGAWWVGGLDGAAPAVAVSHDSGRTWKKTTLPEPATATDTVAVSTLGSEVYAVARNEAGEVLGIYHSTDGRGFAATYLPASTGGQETPTRFTGDPVPLLDGRLLLVRPLGTPSSWWVSEDAGATFTPVAGLPAVGSIRRTYAGYVAYRLFDDTWAAFSTDGADWQKLQVY
ncbi:hypothetical protein AB0J74_05015 [Asanoa sp. NPDC049573]|uniref:hypothetical protein n=1 Tax=Asanoa sp. NPDC049573 TaxID=3155396 RepID=UPI00341236E2